MFKNVITFPASNPKQGWVLFERTCVFAGIQFTKRFMELVHVETNELVGSNSNVILTWQTVLEYWPVLEQGCGKQTSSASI